MSNLDEKAVAAKRKLFARKQAEMRTFFPNTEFTDSVNGLRVSGPNGAAELAYNFEQDWWRFQVRYEQPKEHKLRLWVPHGHQSRVLMAAIRELFATVPTVTCEGCKKVVESPAGFPHVALLDAGWSVKADFGPGVIHNVSGECPDCRAGKVRWFRCEECDCQVRPGSVCPNCGL